MPARALPTATASWLLAGWLAVAGPFAAGAAPAAPAPAEGAALAASLLRLDAPPFVIHYDAVLDRGARELSRAGSRVHVEMVADLGVAPPAPMEVFLLRHVGDVRRLALAGGGVPRWAVGIAETGRGRILLANVDENGARQDLAAVLAHEYSHLALAHATSGRDLPLWFVEGYARMLAHEWSLSRTGALASLAFGGQAIRLSDLADRFPSAPGQVAVAYAESADFVNYLLAEHGRQRFRDLLRGLREGLPFERAVLSAYERGIRTLEADWYRRLRLRYFWVPLLSSGSLLWLAGASLLVLGYRRQRRRAAERLGRWEQEEEQARERERLRREREREREGGEDSQGEGEQAR